MTVLAWLIVGTLAGWLASVIMRTNNSQGMMMDIVLGIVGALVGGLIFNMFGAPGVTGFDIYSLAVATVGSIVLLAVSRLVYRPA